MRYPAYKSIHIMFKINHFAKSLRYRVTHLKRLGATIIID